MLDVEELLDLEDSIRQELDDCLPGALSVMNRAGELETFLKMLGMEHLLQKEPVYQVYTTGKIIVIGQSDVKAEALLSIAKKLGIDKNRFELYLDYEDAKTFNFKKMQWKPQYALVMVGPMPHSGVGKGNSGSIIAALENTEGYPPVVRLGSNGLKITKTDFRDKLEEMLNSKKIA
jgi:hypothetical protein